MNKQENGSSNQESKLARLQNWPKSISEGPTAQMVYHGRRSKAVLGPIIGISGTEHLHMWVLGPSRHEEPHNLRLQRAPSSFIHILWAPAKALFQGST